MTVKLKQLEEFVQGIKQNRIARKDLALKVASTWGCSDYIIQSKIKFMIMFGLIEVSQESNEVFVIKYGKTK